MKIKTSELEGAALDWAVAKAVGQDLLKIDLDHIWLLGYMADGDAPGDPSHWCPHIDWSQGGPLIEKHDVWIAGPTNTDSDGKDNVAWVRGTEGRSSGETKIIAAMRAIVAAELGDEVEVSDELAAPAAS